MSQDSSTILPYDVLEFIIDELGDRNDNETLRSFCLTCRAFVQRCRMHLFSTVEAIQIAAWTNYMATAQRHPLERLAEVFKDNPALGTYVRSVKIVKVPRSNPDVADALVFLNQVNELTLGSDADHPLGIILIREWDTFSPPLRAAYETLIARNPLRKLRMFNFSGVPVELFSKMKLLKNLELRYLEGSLNADSDATQRFVSTDPISLEALRIGAGLDAYFTNVILPSNTFDFAGIQRLTFEVQNTNFKAIEKVLPLIRNLQSFAVKFVDYWPNAISNRIFPKLSHTSRTSLRSISIDSPAIPCSTVIPFADFDEELKKLTLLSSLEDISLSITHLMSAPGTDRASWSCIEDALSSGFPKLRKLNVFMKITSVSSADCLEIEQEAFRELLRDSLRSSAAIPNLVVTQDVIVVGR